MKKLVAAFLLFLLVTIFVIACGSNSPEDSSGGNNVHMSDTNFVVPSIIINKGSSITLISDTGVAHIISNGKWVNTVSEPLTEPGAPVVSNLMFSNAGQSQAIGPFNTAGTFHFYCSVHEAMNLTVIVKGDS